MTEGPGTPRGTAQRGGLFRLAFKAMQQEGLTWREYARPWGVHIITWCPTFATVHASSASDARSLEETNASDDGNPVQRSPPASKLSRFTRHLRQQHILHRCSSTPFIETRNTPLLIALSGRRSETHEQSRCMTTVHIAVIEPFIYTRLVPQEIEELLTNITNDDPATTETQ